MKQNTVDESRLTGGREDMLSIVAVVLLVIGIIGCFAFIVYSGNVTKESLLDGWAENGMSGAWIAVGFGCALQGIVSFAIFSAFAETIRLLKKIAGLQFAGHISQPVLDEADEPVLTD